MLSMSFAQARDWGQGEYTASEESSTGGLGWRRQRGCRLATHGARRTARESGSRNGELNLMETVDAISVGLLSVALMVSALSAWCGWRAAPYIPPNKMKQLGESEDHLVLAGSETVSMQDVVEHRDSLDALRRRYALRAIALFLVGVTGIVRIAMGAPLIAGICGG